MKKNLLVLCCAFALLFSCNVVDDLTKFDLDYQTNYSIPPTTLINSPFNILTPDVTTESESSFENNDTRKDLIESIKLKTIKLTIDTPESGNFNFLKEVHVYIDAEDIEEVEIANIYDLENTNSQTLDLDINDQELKEYIKKDRFNLRIQTITDETISETYDIIIDTKFRVDAEILGV
ncbi:hypothetical protein KO494_00425 [Lacinutrix sp. C3R15]|uniref:hypothetical protein n=1 Tax=Flavobacteriaceae TaxID=49546 RepID=UPI001C09147C|nr:MULTISPECIES: hypothetical protein [Flavobacteriaceae]MBU2937991.1 hypothetical protein [Lacinutrix sp. C3R15]MDO6621305.1 hypothetical protein [Oceanihabitans sp. 1_MG-2023]